MLLILRFRRKLAADPAIPTKYISLVGRHASDGEVKRGANMSFCPVVDLGLDTALGATADPVHKRTHGVRRTPNLRFKTRRGCSGRTHV